MGYLLGSIPVAYLVARSRGIGILEAGTRNPGAANVFRTVSRPLGVFVLGADVLKGFAAVAAAGVLCVPEPIVAVAGAGCLVGHWYPLFLRFRGGTGLASAGGVIIGLSPVAGIIAAAVTLLRWYSCVTPVVLVALATSAFSSRAFSPLLGPPSPGPP